MNVLSYLLSFCECPDKTKDPFEFEYDSDTIEVLRAIYNETEKKFNSDTETDEETDSEDSDYEPHENLSDSETSEDELEPEELQVKNDIKNGLFWLF